MTDIAIRPAVVEQTNTRGLLLRELGFWYVLVFSISSIGLSSSGLFPFSIIAGSFPNASLVGVIVTAMVISIALTWLSSMIGSVVPRYAADYRLSSRLIHPGLAFASSFTTVVIACVVSGSFIATIFKETVPTFIRILAFVLSDDMLLNQAVTVSESYEATVSATVLLLLIFILLILPPKVTRRVLAVGFVLSLIAWLLILGQLSSASTGQFSSNWDQYMGTGSYARQLLDANEQGIQASSGGAMVTLSAGLLAVFWLFFGFASPVAIAGEIKEPHKNLLKGGLAALACIFIILLAAVLLLQRFVSPEWIAAESFLHQLPGYVHLTMPWLPLYTAVIQPNPGITWLIGIIFMFGMLNLAHALIYSASRIVLAWVEDHVLPDTFGFIHPQLKSPLIAVLMGCILAVIGILDGTINGSLLVRLNLVFFWVLSLLLPILSIALLPFIKKDWFHSSPGLVQVRIGRIPLITILGFSILAYLAVVLVATMLTGFLGGIRWHSVILFVLLFSSGLAWFYWRRRELLLKGIKLDEVFKTLPRD